MAEFLALVGLPRTTWTRLASPQRPAFPRAEEIPEAVAAGREKAGGLAPLPPPPGRDAHRHPAEMPTRGLRAAEAKVTLASARALPHPTPPSRRAPADTRLVPSAPGGRQAERGQGPQRGSFRIQARRVQTILGDRWPGGWAGRERLLFLVKMTLKSTSPSSRVVSGVVSARCRVCFWTLCEFGRLRPFPLP